MPVATVNALDEEGLLASMVGLRGWDRPDCDHVQLPAELPSAS